MNGKQKNRMLSVVIAMVWASALGTLFGLGGPAAWADGDFQWAWMKGPSTTLGAASYGTLGLTLASNTPGARSSGASWTAPTGLFWLFGGYGKDNDGNYNLLNDVWKYDRAKGSWTWMKGSSTINATGSYGTLGVAASPNHPGARSAPVSWTDRAGNLWLFGGKGLDSAGTKDYLNDLWKFNTSNSRWAWMKGSSLVSQAGVYGAFRVSAEGNTPGARYTAVTWTDLAGNLWLFGGSGLDGAGTETRMNDLWKYDPNTGNWTWMKGSSTGNASGVYGTRKVFAAANTPGARGNAAVTWTDSNGLLWLFGGFGRDSAGTTGYLNDLWKYDPDTGNWAWMMGSKTCEASGVYGTLGVPAAANTPGARGLGVSWVDAAGALWLFGGDGFDSAGSEDYLNDLWKYDTTTGFWTWMKGSKTINAFGEYGTLGAAAPANTPGARYSPYYWRDSADGLWVLGGDGYASTDDSDRLNDLWRGSVTDTTPPTGTVIINNNRSVTNSPNVTLALTWSDGTGSGVTRMKFSNNGTTWTAWEALAATKAWTLGAGEGHKTVWAMFRDRAGNNSTVYKDYIRVDTTPPTGSILINGGASSTTSPNVSLGLTWSDETGAGVSRMRFSIDGMHWTAWEPPVASKSYTLPSTPKYYTVRVQYLDGGNNYSAVFNDYIKLVTAP